MCNDYRLLADASTIVGAFADLKIIIRFSEGLPNLAPRQDIRITDRAAIVRGCDEAAAGDLVQRRWSWPGPGGRPVYNFRSEGRDFAGGRCVIPADGFYEFTAPADSARDGARKTRKDKWLFTMDGDRPFCIAGLWRAAGEVGEAFTMLTMPPGPDVAPYHDRQIAILDRRDWAGWLDPTIPARGLLKPLPAGTLRVERVAERSA